jgi:hypothetical protein
MEFENLKQRIEYLTKLSDTMNMLKHIEGFSQDWLDIDNYITDCYQLNNKFDKMLKDKYKLQVEWVLEKFVKLNPNIVINETITRHKENLFSIHIDMGEPFDISETSFRNDNFFMVNSVLIEVDIKNRIISHDASWRLEKTKELFENIILPSKRGVLLEGQEALSEARKSPLRFLPKKKRLIASLEKNVENVSAKIKEIEDFMLPDRIQPLFENYNKKVTELTQNLSRVMYESTDIEYFIQS